MRARYVPACQVPLLRPDRNLARDRDGNWYRDEGCTTRFGDGLTGTSTN
jgi:hypothetical protein